MNKSKTNILVICGPTASGKTSLALKIASFLPKVNILSVDSRQIYKDLDIITGKDIPSDLSTNIKFFGLDLIDPDKKFNLSDFTDYARNIIKKSVEGSTPLIIVGGTGLFLKSVTSNFLNVNVPPDLDLRQKLEKLSISDLKKTLSQADPDKYNSLNNSDINNPRRLIRAIEISLYSHSDQAKRVEEPQSASSPAVILSDRRKSKDLTQSINFYWIGLKVSKSELQEKIRNRVIERLNAGAIKEVEFMLKNYPDQKLPVYTSLGIKDIIDYLNKETTFEELITAWTRHEVDYARRQIVWFQKQPSIVWYDKDSIDLDQIKLFAEKIK